MYSIDYVQQNKLFAVSQELHSGHTSGLLKQRAFIDLRSLILTL